MTSYADVIRGYRHYKGKQKYAKDPKTGRDIELFKTYPGGHLAYYWDENGDAQVFTIDIKDGSTTSNIDKAIPWKSLEGTRLIRRFNDHLNTSLYAWYNLRDIIDYSSVEFEGESTTFEIANTEGRVTAKSSLEGKWIYLELYLDGTPVDLKGEGLFNNPRLWTGIRTIVRDSISRQWTSVVTEYLRKHELLVDTPDSDELGIDLTQVDNLDYEFVAKSAVKIAKGQLNDLEIKDTGSTLEVRRTSNPIFKVEYNYSNGDMKFLNQLGKFLREDNPHDLAKSLLNVSRLADKLYESAHYWKYQIDAVNTISKGLKELSGTDSAATALRVASNILGAITKGRTKLSSDRELKIRLDQLYNDTRSHLVYLVDTLDANVDALEPLINSRAHDRAIAEADSLLNLLRLHYNKALQGGVK